MSQVKIYPISDLHFRSTIDAIDWAKEEVPKDADIIVMAGDIANGAKQGVKYLKQVLQTLPDKHIVLCLGNHDYWGEVSLYSTWYRWRELEKLYPNFHFVDRGYVDILGVRFIGGTLWTDMQLEDNFYVTQNVYHCQWPDYLNVGFDAHIVGFPAHEFVQQFKLYLSRIFELVSDAVEAGIPFYVLTHHLPDPESLDKRYNGSEFNAFYASKQILENLPVEKGIWQHGHTHAAKNYHKHGWNVICNPRGYLMERFSCDVSDKERLADKNLILTIGE